MTSYIQTTMERFKNFDLSQGYPFRELVGCLLWITLNVMGPELLRVKDLARMSNSYAEQDYNLGLKVLHCIFVRRHHGIVIFRHGGGREVIPSSIRPIVTPPSDDNLGKPDASDPDDLGVHISESHNEITKHSLCRGKKIILRSEFLLLGR